MVAHLHHQHFICTAVLKKPPTTGAEMDAWLIELVAKVGMVVLYGPFSTRCDELDNEGVTGMIGLTTSHSSAHVWDRIEKPFMKFDLYSCRPFDVETVLDHLKIFEPVSCEYMVLDRNGSLKVADQGERIF
jgi:S-adenosylmethionine/arginine decarboxylase-like enzyme